MKIKIIISFVCLLFCVNIISQTRYYDNTKTFYEDGYTYQCDRQEWGIVDLYNKANQYVYDIQETYRDGTAMEDSVKKGLAPYLERDNWTKQTCQVIVNNAFTAEDRERIGDENICVKLRVDGLTGKIIEVDFDFYYSTAFATFPVSFYRQIELELKDKIWFTLSEIGKKHKYVSLGWLQKINRVVTGEIQSGIETLAPNASKIFKNTDLMEKYWEQLESSIEFINSSCIGKALYDGLVNRYADDKILIKREPVYIPAIRYGFSFSDEKRIVMEQLDDPVALFKEMYMAYRMYNQSKEAWNKSGLNYEIEAMFALYVFVRNLPDSYAGKNKWMEFFKSDSVGRDFARLFFYINEKGLWRPGANADDIATLGDRLGLVWSYSTGYPARQIDSSWGIMNKSAFSSLLKNCEE